MQSWNNTILILRGVRDITQRSSSFVPLTCLIILCIIFGWNYFGLGSYLTQTPTLKPKLGQLIVKSSNLSIILVELVETIATPPWICDYLFNNWHTSSSSLCSFQSKLFHMIFGIFLQNISSSNSLIWSPRKKNESSLAMLISSLSYII